MRSYVSIDHYHIAPYQLRADTALLRDTIQKRYTGKAANQHRAILNLFIIVWYLPIRGVRSAPAGYGKVA